jgi:hypothetical protein
MAKLLKREPQMEWRFEYEAWSVCSGEHRETKETAAWLISHREMTEIFGQCWLAWGWDEDYAELRDTLEKYPAESHTLTLLCESWPAA